MNTGGCSAEDIYNSWHLHSLIAYILTGVFTITALAHYLNTSLMAQMHCNNCEWFLCTVYRSTVWGNIQCNFQYALLLLIIIPVAT